MVGRQHPTLLANETSSWSISSQKSLPPSFPGFKNRRCSGLPPHLSPRQATLTSHQRGMKGLLILPMRKRYGMRILQEVVWTSLGRSGSSAYPFLSGVETIAHLKENGRMTIMLTAFKGPPRIVRLFGSGNLHIYLIVYFKPTVFQVPYTSSAARNMRLSSL